MADSGLVAWVAQWLERKRKLRRVRRLLRRYGCVCYCPNCRDILHGQEPGPFRALPVGARYEVADCRACGHTSRWDFSAPVPLLAKDGDR